MLLAIFGPFFVGNPNALSNTELAAAVAQALARHHPDRAGRLRPARGQRARLAGDRRGRRAAGHRRLDRRRHQRRVRGRSHRRGAEAVHNVVLVIPTLPLVIVIMADVKSSGLVPLIVIIALHQLGGGRPGAAGADAVGAQPRVRAGRPRLRANARGGSCSSRSCPTSCRSSCPTSSSA